MKTKHRPPISRNNLVVTLAILFEERLIQLKSTTEWKSRLEIFPKKITHCKKESLDQISLYKFQSGKKLLSWIMILSA